MDLSKAFDHLPRDLLLKLKSGGLSISTLNPMESYLKNRKQCAEMPKEKYGNVIKKLYQLGLWLFPKFWIS
jgi:hypothetical protein